MGTRMTDPAAGEWRVIRHRKVGFSLSHPPDWRAIGSVMTSLVTVVGPELEEGFQPNLNVIRKVDDTRLDLDRLTQASIEQMSRILTDPMVIDVHAMELDERPARHIVIAHRQGIFGLTSDQWLLKEAGHIWLLSSATRSEAYESHGILFGRIARSLRIGDDS